MPTRKSSVSTKPREPAASWRERAQALPGARRRAFPAGFAPELCIQKKTPPEGDEWMHETKWDGYRLLADLDRARVKLRSRNDLDWTMKAAPIAAAIEALPVDSVRLDGELVALDAIGRSDFSGLQGALKAGRASALRYVVFDMPGIEGVDLSATPLVERKALLEQLIRASKSKSLVFSTHVIGQGRELFAAAVANGLEGIVSKRVDSHYVQARSPDWIKIKGANTDEFVVVGYTAPKGSREGFGALLLAQPERGGFRYVGRVGTGFDDATLRSFARKLAALRQREAVVELPAHVPFRAASVQWVEPVLVAEVEFRGWAKEGLLRQASFMRLRDDKGAKDVASAKPRQASGKTALRKKAPKP
jgi:bifunctional non-homologous end joining protein LigD